MMKSIILTSLFAATLSANVFGPPDTNAPMTETPAGFDLPLRDILLVGPPRLDSIAYKGQTVTTTKPAQVYGTVTAQGTGMTITEETSSGSERFIELTALYTRSHFLTLTAVQPSPSTQLYVGAYCLTSSGDSCGFSAYPLLFNQPTYVTWISNGLPLYDMDRVRWSIFYREGGDHQIGDTFDILYEGSESVCKTTHLQTPCLLLCHSDSFSSQLQCTDSLTLMNLPCECGADIVVDSDIELATRIITISLIIVITGVLGCCGFCWWRSRNESRAAAQVEQRRQQNIQNSEPQSQEEIEATAASLMEQLNASPTSPDGQACCVCLETTSTSATSPDSDDTWISTPCSHNMHHGCLKQWLVQRLTKKHPMTCPVCRAALSETVGSPPRVPHSEDETADASPDAGV